MDYPGRFIAGFMAVILILIFPLPYIAQSNSENIDYLVDDYTQALSDSIRDKGYIDKSMYEDYVDFLDTTGEAYDIDIEDIHPVTGDEVDTAKNVATGFQVTKFNQSKDNEADIELGGKTIAPFIQSGIDSASGVNGIFHDGVKKNASLNSQKINSFAAHTHTDNCYAGHRHNSNCQIAGDMTRSVYIQYVSSYSGGTITYQFLVYCASCNNLLCSISIFFSSGGSFTQYGYNTQYYRYDNYGRVYNDASHQGYGSGNYYDETANYNNVMCSETARALYDYVSNVSYPQYDGYYWYKTGNITWSFGDYPVLDKGADGILTKSGVPYIGCPYCGSYGANYSCGQTQDETPICDRVVTSITPTNPSQNIIQGNSIISTATATYLDGHTGTVNCSVSNFDTNTIGNQTATLTYTGLVGTAKNYSSVSFNVYVNVVSAKVLSSITVTPTDQIINRYGTPSFSVMAYYSDNTSKVLTSSQYSMTALDTSVTGQHLLTFSYTDGGVTKTANASVYVNALTSISASPATQTVPINTPQSSLSFTVTATYLYGGNKTLTGGYDISGYSPSVSGQQNITITYMESGVIKNTAVTVYVDTLTAITVLPSSQTVKLNTPQSALSLSVTASYLYGGNRTVSGYSISGYSPTIQGQQNITISYTENGVTRTASSIVNVDALASISATPYEQTVERYTPKSSLAYTITASYLYSGNKTVSTGYIIEGYSPSLLGDQNITISYTDNGVTKTTTAKVYVSVLHKKCPKCQNVYDMNTDDTDPGCPYCRSLIVGLNVTPEQVEVTKGDSLPITVSAEYGDGSEAVVYGWTSNYDANQTGLQNVTVVYGGYAADITVWVNDAMISCPICKNTYPASYDKCPFCAEKVVSISVNPNAITVNQYENIELTVTAYYADGHSKTVTEWTIDKDTKKAGTYQATVSYQGTSTTIALTVIPLTAIQCPICGLIYDTTKNPIGCPICSKTLTGIEAYLTSGANLVQFGSIPDIEVVLVFKDNHREIADDEYKVENYDAFKLGEQSITIRYKEFSTVLDIVVVNTLETITCPNGHIYYRNEDASDPGCPYCNISADAGTVYYFDITYTKDILDAIYTDGIYYFKTGDYITVHVVKRDVSLLLKMQKISLKTILLGRKEEFIYGGEVFE